jgi:epoxyqueuosine reductase
MDALTRAQLLKKWAYDAGFLYCGISKSGFLEKEAERLETWLASGYQGEMKWLENHFDLRLDPSKLVPGAKSVVSFAYNYFPNTQQQKDCPKIAKYAYGVDYHKVVKKKLKTIVQQMQSQFGAFSFRIFVDSGPVLERVWAEKSGMGWIGKNGLLLNKNQGSFFFLAEVICDLDFAYDAPFTKDYCGTCTACVDACPTQAILPNKTLNAKACISYLTIELKESIPNDYKANLDNWMFGCDICQDVCPWNRFSKQHNEPEFNPITQLLEMKAADWKEITEEVFQQVFGKSPLKRPGLIKLKQTVSLLQDTISESDD